MPNGELSVYAQPVASANAAAQQRQQTNLLRNQSALVGKQVGSYERDQNRDDYTAQTSRLSAEASASNAQSRGRELTNDERGLRAETLAAASVGALTIWQNTEGPKEVKDAAATQFLNSEAVPEVVGTGQNAWRARGNIPFDREQMMGVVQTQAEHLARTRPNHQMWSVPGQAPYAVDEGDSQQVAKAMAEGAGPSPYAYSLTSDPSSPDFFSRQQQEALYENSGSQINLIEGGDEILSMLEHMNDEQLGTPGSFISWADRFLKGTTGMINTIGNAFGESAGNAARSDAELYFNNFDPEAIDNDPRFNDKFWKDGGMEEMANETATIKAKMLMWVYMQARAAEPNRPSISNSDVQGRLSQIDISSKSQASAVIRATQEASARGLAVQWGLTPEKVRHFMPPSIARYIDQYGPGLREKHFLPNKDGTYTSLMSGNPNGVAPPSGGNNVSNSEQVTLTSGNGKYSITIGNN